MDPIEEALGRPSTVIDPEEFIKKTATKYGVSPRLAAAIAKTESNFNPSATGKETKTGERAEGAMQLMPETAKRHGVTNRLSLYQNAEGGVKELKRLIDKYGEDDDRVAAAYNAGDAAVDKYGGVPPFPETQEYIKKFKSNLGLDPIEEALGRRSKESVKKPATQKEVLPPTAEGRQEARRKIEQEWEKKLGQPMQKDFNKLFPERGIAERFLTSAGGAVGFIAPSGSIYELSTDLADPRNTVWVNGVPIPKMIYSDPVEFSKLYGGMLADIGSGLVTSHTDRLVAAFKNQMEAQHEWARGNYGHSIEMAGRAMVNLLGATPFIGPLAHGVYSEFAEGNIAGGMGSLFGLWTGVKLAGGVAKRGLPPEYTRAPSGKVSRRAFIKPGDEFVRTESTGVESLYPEVSFQTKTGIKGVERIPSLDLMKSEQVHPETGTPGITRKAAQTMARTTEGGITAKPVREREGRVRVWYENLRQRWTPDTTNREVVGRMLQAKSRQIVEGPESQQAQFNKLAEDAALSAVEKGQPSAIDQLPTLDQEIRSALMPEPTEGGVPPRPSLYSEMAEGLAGRKADTVAKAEVLSAISDPRRAGNFIKSLFSRAMEGVRGVKNIEKALRRRQLGRGEELDYGYENWKQDIREAAVKMFGMAPEDAADGFSIPLTNSMKAGKPLYKLSQDTKQIFAGAVGGVGGPILEGLMSKVPGSGIKRAPILAVFEARKDLGRVLSRVGGSDRAALSALYKAITNDITSGAGKAFPELGSTFLDLSRYKEQYSTLEKQAIVDYMLHTTDPNLGAGLVREIVKSPQNVRDFWRTVSTDYKEDLLTGRAYDEALAGLKTARRHAIQDLLNNNTTTLPTGESTFNYRKILSYLDSPEASGFRELFSLNPKGDPLAEGKNTAATYLKDFRNYIAEQVRIDNFPSHENTISTFIKNTGSKMLNEEVGTGLGLKWGVKDAVQMDRLLDIRPELRQPVRLAMTQAIIRDAIDKTTGIFNFDRLNNTLMNRQRVLQTIFKPYQDVYGRTIDPWVNLQSVFREIATSGEKHVSFFTYLRKAIMGAMNPEDVVTNILTEDSKPFGYIARMIRGDDHMIQRVAMSAIRNLLDAVSIEGSKRSEFGTGALETVAEGGRRGPGTGATYSLTSGTNYDKLYRSVRPRLTELLDGMTSPEKSSQLLKDLDSFSNMLRGYTTTDVVISSRGGAEALSNIAQVRAGAAAMARSVVEGSPATAMVKLLDLVGKVGFVQYYSRTTSHPFYTPITHRIGLGLPQLINAMRSNYQALPPEFRPVTRRIIIELSAISGAGRKEIEKMFDSVDKSATSTVPPMPERPSMITGTPAP